MKNSDLIKEFIDESVIEALSNALSSDNIDEVLRSANVIASNFGSDFHIYTNDNVERFIQSFKKNLSLLIQKTWVDQSDIMLKEEINSRLEKYTAAVADNKWAESYENFLHLNEDVLGLLFGPAVKTSEFEEYSLRIDPEFGIYCWYVKSLPVSNTWSNDKNKILLLIAMYFLANY